MKRFVLSLSALLLVLLTSSLLSAQDTNSAASDEETTEAEQQAQVEPVAIDEEALNPVLDEDEDVGVEVVGLDVNVDEVDEGLDVGDVEAEESSARFIPTEEISQDLGVSFPVNI